MEIKKIHNIKSTIKTHDHPYLKDAIKQMLNGKGIKKPISKSMGCSIKFN